jgi:hypothetical protein
VTDVLSPASPAYQAWGCMSMSTTPVRGWLFPRKGKLMSLFARSDMMSVSIPETSGGCGKTHSRPVTKGVSRRVWELNCLPCEAYLRGDDKPKVIRVTGGDKNKGIPGRMDHVADSDPHWSSTPETVPLSPDEEGVHARRNEVATQQLQLLQASAAAKAAGFDIPPEALWLLEEKLGVNLVHGTLECMNGHSNPAGTKFCGECGVSMNIRAAVTPVDPPGKTDGDLSKLSIRELKELCKQDGLPMSGTKKQLVERLSL